MDIIDKLLILFPAMLLLTVVAAIVSLTAINLILKD